MTTNRSVRILLAAVLIAAAITTVKLYGRDQAAAPAVALSYLCFEAGSGWGYDIVAGDKVLIHQPFDPEVAGRKGFTSRAAAEANARIVIDKIKLGQTPVFSAPAKQRTGSLPAH